ncbi:MAG: hypothetical protein PHU25_07315 [Deltaproteobacteria bacterium]|nr:hypothetical protein [Deltaproteobacteria bacterium]
MKPSFAGTKIVWVAALAALVAVLGSGSVLAQGKAAAPADKAKAAAPAAKANAILPMKERVATLESNVEELQRILKDVTGGDSPDQIRVRQQDLQKELDKIRKQLDEMKGKASEADAKAEEQATGVEEAAKKIEELTKELAALKKVVEEQGAHKNAGYDKGFFIQSNDGKHKLVVGGFAKPFYRAAWQKEWEADKYGNLTHDANGDPQGGDVRCKENGFGLAATRLYVVGQMFEVVKGKIEFDYGTLSGEVQYPPNANMPAGAKYNRLKITQYQPRFLDVYGEFAPFPELNVRAGQFKVPFDRETLFGSSSLTFTSRSLINRAYPRWGEIMADTSALSYHWDYEMQRAASFDYDRGFALMGSVEEGLFSYAAGLFNGGGSNLPNDNRDLLAVLRVMTEPLGRTGADMSDLSTSKDPLLGIGAAFAYDLPKHKDPLDPSSKLTYNSQDVNLTGDVHFKWMGASFFGELFWRKSDSGGVRLVESSPHGVVQSLGGTVQGAYYNDYTHLEPAIRYAVYDSDLDRYRNHIHEITAALNYYPFGQNLKLELEYRGLFPANMQAAYLMPWATWFDNWHELTIMAQAAF